MPPPPAQHLAPPPHTHAPTCICATLSPVCAGRLEQQLGLWGALSEAQRLAVADALLDWTQYADRLDRRDLRDFCAHSVASQWQLARSR